MIIDERAFLTVRTIKSARSTTACHPLTTAILIYSLRSSCLIFITQVIKRVKCAENIEEDWMRVSKERAAQNRQKILTAATRLFRERGIGATAVDAITEDAGLTHGAVYSQFGSKEAIAAEAMREVMAGARRLWRRLLERNGRAQTLPAIVAGYLSRVHRDSAGQGCLVAALGSEIAKQPERVRDAFTAELQEGLDFLAELMPRTGAACAYDDAIATFASMVGGLILARAVSDERLSNRILAATAQRVIHPARSRRTSGRSSSRTRSSRRTK
jgi:TetR/AcrR family transcriptional repressor of nem operon